MISIIHKSVLLQESIENLCVRQDGIYVDGTAGGGGHGLEICKRLGAKGRLIAIDQDKKALSIAYGNLLEYKEKVIFIHSNFSNISEILKEQTIHSADGFLLDLGVSSFQLDEAERGFSYMQDAPLDMRMNPEKAFSAYDVVNTYEESRLSAVIKNYGEERWAKRISEFIVANRRTSPITTTFELVSVIKKAIPKGAREDGPHPAKRTFQAIRIEVNNELDVLEKTIEDMASFLNPGGRICIITFHSLEDRIVKNTFRRLAFPCTCPPKFPICICGKKPLLKAVTKKPIIPNPEETTENHRARSAKLRVAERI